MKIFTLTAIALLSACATTPEPSRYISLAFNLSGEPLSVRNSLESKAKKHFVEGLDHRDFRSITVGAFSTTKIKIIDGRVLSSVPTWKLFPKQSSKKQKLIIDHSFNFYQSSPSKSRSHISCVDLEGFESVKTDGFSAESRYLEVDPFACQIQSESSSAIWIVKMNSMDRADSGIIRSDAGNEIQIEGVKRSSIENIGYEFLINGQSVALLSMVGAGQVTLHKNLNPELKHVIVSTMSALITEYGLIL